MQIIQIHYLNYVYDFISFLHKMEYPIEYFIEDLTEYLCIPCRIPSGIAYRISPRIPFIYDNPCIPYIYAMKYPWLVSQQISVEICFYTKNGGSWGGGGCIYIYISPFQPYTGSDCKIVISLRDSGCRAAILAEELRGRGSSKVIWTTVNISSRGLYRVIYQGVLYGLLRGILGVQTTAHLWAPN